MLELGFVTDRVQVGVGPRGATKLLRHRHGTLQVIECVTCADPDNSFTKVTYIGPARNRQCRIQYDEGDLQDLEDWVLTRLLACRWGERKALLRDEERATRLEGANNEIWDHVTEEGISAIMTASGEYGGFLRHWGYRPRER